MRDQGRRNIIIPPIAMDMEASHMNMGIWTPPNAAMGSNMDFF